MKEANIISIVGAYEERSPELFNSYMEYHSIAIRDAELDDLTLFIDELKNICNDIVLFDKYFVGYRIPQIGKEFDLLRIGSETIVNIELKRTNTGSKIKEQLLRNKYYLDFLNKKSYYFTFVSDEKKLYTIDDNQNLVEVGFDYLLNILSVQKVVKIKDINALFNPSNYLVSPFNSTDEFVDGKYFLTSRQEEIKDIVKELFVSPQFSILSIKGKAGTGKTLLTYDIVKEFLKDKISVLIIHCGYLNEGHIKLRDNYGWDIIEIKHFIKSNIKDYKLIIVDEAQRIYPAQLIDIISEIKINSSNCIFSHDEQQCLRNWEINNDIDGQIAKELTYPSFELTSKIRTNKEISIFVKALFDKRAPLVKTNFSNIELNYFDRYSDIKSFLELQKKEGWKIINYTPTRNVSTYDSYHVDGEYDNVHRVIGQEYNNVVAVIDKHFYYNNSNLSVRHYNHVPFYLPTKMLFQIVTRTRLKLSIVIVNNKEMLERCLSILN